MIYEVFVVRDSKMEMNYGIVISAVPVDRMYYLLPRRSNWQRALSSCSNYDVTEVCLLKLEGSRDAESVMNNAHLGNFSRSAIDEDSTYAAFIYPIEEQSTRVQEWRQTLFQVSPEILGRISGWLADTIHRGTNLFSAYSIFHEYRGIQKLNLHGNNPSSFVQYRSSSPMVTDVHFATTGRLLWIDEGLGKFGERRTTGRIFFRGGRKIRKSTSERTPDRTLFKRRLI